ncbi:MAG: hypothetical protein K2L11_04150 [Muribaculaceae bacterium]|nr:hypothetical protein [Muribaculaceae bacterium]
MAEHTSLVLVEGKSEEKVFPELCRKCGVAINFDIKSENCLNEVKKSIKTHLKSTNRYRKLWIVIDADTDFEAAWNSIKYILRQSGKYEVSGKEKMPEDGFIIKPINPEDLTVGVWIMPNNKDVGMLEDFMLGLIPDTDGLLPLASRDVEALDLDRDLYPGIFKRVHKSKAEIHTWLAWHDTPGETLSVAVQKHLFATDKDLCLRFAAWLDHLNNPEDQP